MDDKANEDVDDDDDGGVVFLRETRAGPMSKEIIDLVDLS